MPDDDEGSSTLFTRLRMPENWRGSRLKCCEGLVWSMSKDVDERVSKEALRTVTHAMAGMWESHLTWIPAFARKANSPNHTLFRHDLRGGEMNSNASGSFSPFDGARDAR